MCNLYTQTKSVDAVARLFRDLQIPLRFPEGMPNLAAARDRDHRSRPDRPRASAAAGFELVLRRWSWPGAGRQAGLQLPLRRARVRQRALPDRRRRLLEFTTPADPKQKRKDNGASPCATAELFAIAGLWRTTRGRRGLHHADDRPGGTSRPITTARSSFFRPRFHALARPAGARLRAFWTAPAGQSRCRASC